MKLARDLTGFENLLGLSIPYSESWYFATKTEADKPNPRMITSLSIKYRSLYPEISKILNLKIQGNNILNERL